MRPLFLFGTLQHRPLLEAVLGACDHLTASPAALPDHRVSAVAEGPFPMILPDNGAVAEGMLIRGLRDDDLARLDFYEAPFGYTLKDVVLADGCAAQAYFPPDTGCTPEGNWTVADWAKTWGAVSVVAAREVMDYMGQKSPAELAFMFPMIRARAWSVLNAKGSRHSEDTFRGKVEIAAQRRPYAHYFTLEEYDLRHERFDGSMSPLVERAVFRAPDVAQVLPYDPHRDCVLVVEQMRMGPLGRGDARLWQLEPIAGRLDAGESPEVAVRREAMEEAGLEVGALFEVAQTYCSPGTSSEFYYIFVGFADLPDSITGKGGLAEEDEDIRSHLLGFEELMAMCDGVQIANAPLVMAAYWLARHRDRLRAEAGA